MMMAMKMMMMLEADFTDHLLSFRDSAKHFIYIALFNAHKSQREITRNLAQMTGEERASARNKGSTVSNASDRSNKLKTEKWIWHIEVSELDLHFINLETGAYKH